MRFLTPVLFCATALAGCATAIAPRATPDPRAEAGRWRAKALIKDKEQKRSYLVNLEFNLSAEGCARLDVTTTLGTGLASIVLRDRDVRIALIPQKQFYEGPAGPGVLMSVMRMPFDPRWITPLFVNRPIDGPGWICRDAADGRSCADAARATEVKWIAGADHEIVRIDHAKASVQINVRSHENELDSRPNLFALEAPGSYQKTTLK